MQLHCDNGTNFVGANGILQLECEQAIKDYNLEIQKELNKYRTKFMFNTSLSPWMRGIWERGIGSIKYHLKRTIGEKILTYEELSTVLCQVEAILNSRPIVSLSENPDDLDILTPGHFLVGSALTAPIEQNLLDTTLNRLSRWELCNRMKQEFWCKWSNDYITQLQKRSKWSDIEKNLAVGDIVLLKEENTPPLRWPLGRISKIFPDEDGLVGVVEVQAKGKIYKRPIVKLAPLPIDDKTSYSSVNIADKTSISNNGMNNRENEHKQTGSQNKKRLEKKKKSNKNSVKSHCIFVSNENNTNSNVKKVIQTLFMCGRTEAYTILAVLMFCLLFRCTEATNYEINSFGNDTSVYFKPNDKMVFIEGKWNLFTYMSIHGRIPE